MMRLPLIAIIAFATLALTCCQKDGSKMTDTQLIEAIQGASNKQDVEVGSLPRTCMDELEKNYDKSVVEDARLAPKLGYEVGARRGRGSHIGAHEMAYFNLDGRLLRDNDQDGKGRFDKFGHHGDLKDCFELVYPVTFIMPDGSNIVANNQHGAWKSIKAWYLNNPGSKDKPAFQYPLDIEYKDGSVLTINSDGDLKSAYAGC